MFISNQRSGTGPALFAGKNLHRQKSQASKQEEQKEVGLALAS